MRAHASCIYKRRAQLGHRDIRILTDQFLKERPVRVEFPFALWSSLRRG